jgi:Fe-S-cluster containining protein
VVFAPTGVVREPRIMTQERDLSALRSWYAEVDQLLHGWTCAASADCCHFARTGREPYLWPNEWALLERGIAARGLRSRALAVIREDERACRLLGADGRCTVYPVRPFGCRTFFCERASGPTRSPPRAEIAAIARRIADAAVQQFPDCDGPRPLSTWLARRGGSRR